MSPRATTAIPAAAAGLTLLGLVLAAGTAGAAAPPAPPAFRVPRPVERELKNGMRVLLVEDHRVPLVYYRFLVRVGSADEPAEKAGLASLTLSVLRQGTIERDAKTLAAAIDSVGGDVEVDPGCDFSTISGQFLAHDWSFGVDLLSELVQDAAFRPEEIERQRSQVLARIEQLGDQNDRIADEHASALVYGTHPYARPVEGDEGSVTSIRRDDVVAFHQRYFRPNRSLLVVVGDFEIARVMGEVEQQFQDWEKAETPKRASPELPAFGENRIRLLDKPGVTQAEIRIASTGAPRTSPDYFPLQIMNYILGGGGFSSRLMVDVRAKGGLTYDAHTSLDMGLDRGAFFLATFTKNATVKDAIATSLATVGRLQAEGPTARELEDAKRFYVGSLPLRVQTARGLAVEWAGIDYYDLGKDYFDRYPERVRAVTAADVKRVAARYLRTDSLVIVAVGPSAQVKDQLGAFGDVEVLDYRSPTGAVPQSHVEDATPEGLFTPESVAKARTVVERALKAHGGLAKVRAVKDVQTQGSFTVLGPQGSVDGQMAMMLKLPDKTRIELAMLGQQGVQVLDGARGWISSGGQVKDMSEDQAHSMRVGLKVQVLTLLRRLSDPESKIGYEGEDRVGDEMVDVLRIMDPDTGPLRVAFSKTTGLLLRLDQEEASPLTGARVQMTRVYSDFRAVNGLQVPFKTARYAGGQRLWEDTLSTVAVNQGLLDSIFRRPTR